MLAVSEIRVSEEILSMKSKNTLTIRDLPGMRFGRVTVLRLDHRKGNNYYFLCRCDCGEEIVRRSTQFYYGKFFTCGSPACRFWEGVNKDGPTLNHDLGNCWEWVKATKDDGYGVCNPEPGQSRRAHVYSWFLHYGPKPEDKWVLHKCDNRPCIRPDHLFLGDHDENMHDMAAKGRATRHGRVYLSFLEKQRMVERYRQGGVPQHALAADFGVSMSTVRRTLRGASNGRN